MMKARPALPKKPGEVTYTSSGFFRYNLCIEIVMDRSLSVPTVDVRTRIPDEVIRELARRIAEEFAPLRILLFGSYAYGHPRPESDVDLLVVMDTSLRETQQALAIRQHLKPLFGVDILVYTPERLEQRLAWGDSFLREIVERGITLYKSDKEHL
jgi:predicted nucleotidyltransferase